MDIIRF